ncbi:MAG: hypothetical protein WA611_09715, partial [Candidatus Acidiferrales bacterium]
ACNVVSIRQTLDSIKLPRASTGLTLAARRQVARQRRGSGQLDGDGGGGHEGSSARLRDDKDSGF